MLKLQTSQEPGGLKGGQDYDVLQLSKMFFESRSHPLASEKLKLLLRSLATFKVSRAPKLRGKTFSYLLL